MTTDFTDIHPEPAGDFFDHPEPDPDVLEEFDEPDPEFLKSRKPRNSVQYETKVRGTLNNMAKLLMQSPSTVPDAATIVMYGQDFSKAMGVWAADSPQVRKAIDFINGGTANPAVAAVVAFLPMALQILRNHEPSAEVTPVREIRIPFLKRTIKVRFKIKLGRLRNLTNDPKEFTQWVFSNPKIQEAMAKQGMNLAGNTASSNGKK